MNLFKGLLFLHGHIVDPTLAHQLADAPRPDPRVIEARRRHRERLQGRRRAVVVRAMAALSPFR